MDDVPAANMRSPVDSGAAQLPHVQLFQVNESLEPVQALVQYGRSALPFQRLAYAQGIAAAAAAASYDDVKQQLVPLALDLLRDPEADIRVAVLRQLPELGCAVIATGCGPEQQQVVEGFLEGLHPMLLADDDEASQTAVTSYQQLVALLPQRAAAQATLRTLRKLDSQHLDEATLAAVRVFAHAAGAWSPEQLAQHIPPLLRQWGGHRDFSVREALACCMSLIGSHAPQDSWRRALLPCFQELCVDTNWRVRRAAAADLPRLAQRLQSSKPTDAAADAGGGSTKGGADGSHATTMTTSSSWNGFGSQMSEQAGSTGMGAAGWQPLCLPGMAGALLGPLGTCCGAATTTSRGSSPAFLSPRVPVPSPAATPGAALIMGSHPMRSSLIVDEVLASGLVGRSRGVAGGSCPLGRTGAGMLGGVLASPAASSSNLSCCGNSSGTDDDSEVPACRSNNAVGGSGSGSGSNNSSSGSLSSWEGGAAGCPNCALHRQHPVAHTLWAWLRECMELLSVDSSHWVKVGALDGLGPLLLLLPPCQLSQALVQRYLAMANSSVVVNGISVALACARSFGGLVERVGGAAWPMFRAAWGHLQASRDPAVLQQVVAALPRLATLLERGVVGGELLPALGALLHQHLSWLDGALAPRLGELLLALPPAGQDMLLEVVPLLVASDKERCRTWRLRHTVAGQLTGMAAAVSQDVVSSVLWPAAITLCQDPVAAVREVAAAQVGGLLTALQPGALQPAAGTCASVAEDGSTAADAAEADSYSGPRAYGGQDGYQDGTCFAAALHRHSSSGRQRLQHSTDATTSGDDGDESDMDEPPRRRSDAADTSSRSSSTGWPSGGVLAGRGGSSGLGQVEEGRGLPLAGSPWPSRLLGSSFLADADSDGEGAGRHDDYYGASSSSSRGAGAGMGYGPAAGLAHPALVVVSSAPAAPLALPILHHQVQDTGPLGYDEEVGLPCALSPPEEGLPCGLAPADEELLLSVDAFHLDQPQQQQQQQVAEFPRGGGGCILRSRMSDSDSTGMGQGPAEQPFRSALSSPGPSPPTSPTPTTCRAGAAAAPSAGQDAQQQQQQEEEEEAPEGTPGDAASSAARGPGTGSSSSDSGKPPRPHRRVSFIDEDDAGSPSPTTSSSTEPPTPGPSPQPAASAPSSSQASGPAAGAGAHGLIHPAMMPVGSWATRQVGGVGFFSKRSQSAGDLTRSNGHHGPSSNHHHGAGGIPRRSSTSRLGRSSNSSGGSSSGGSSSGGSSGAGAVPSGGLHRALMAAAARDPKLAAPAQYVDALLASFAQGPTYQARQLFAPIALSMLAGVGQQLTASQQQQLWAALMQLAQDEVASVRQALAAAVAPAAAAAMGREVGVEQGSKQPWSPPPVVQQPQEEEAGPAEYRAPLATVSLVSKQPWDKCAPCPAPDAAGVVCGTGGAPAAVEESVLKLRDCQQMQDLLALLAAEGVQC